MVLVCACVFFFNFPVPFFFLSQSSWSYSFVFFWRFFCHCLHNSNTWCQPIFRRKMITVIVIIISSIFLLHVARCCCCHSKCDVFFFFFFRNFVLVHFLSLALSGQIYNHVNDNMEVSQCNTTSKRKWRSAFFCVLSKTTTFIELIERYFIMCEECRYRCGWKITTKYHWHRQASGSQRTMRPTFSWFPYKNGMPNQHFYSVSFVSALI